MMRSIQLGSTLKHVASCIKFSRLKESVKYRRFVFSNIGIFDRFSKSKEMFWLGGWYVPMISYFLFHVFISKFIASTSVFSLCEFGCLHSILSLTYKEKTSTKTISITLEHNVPFY